MTAVFGPVNPTFRLFNDAEATPVKAVGAITGSTFVKLVAGGTFQVPNVSTCGAGEQAFGVAAWDAADGDILTVKQIGTFTVKAGAALTAPVQVQSDAAGKAIPLAAGKRLGQVHQDAAINADAGVRLSL